MLGKLRDAWEAVRTGSDRHQREVLLSAASSHLLAFPLRIAVPVAVQADHDLQRALVPVQPRNLGTDAEGWAHAHCSSHSPLFPTDPMSSRLLCTRSRGSRWAGQIPSLTTVAYRQDGDQVSLIAVEGYISGVAKPDEPLTKAGRHRPGLPAEFGMCAQQFHTLTDCLKGAPGEVAAIRRQEIVQS
jgi:hypothetical protein